MEQDINEKLASLLHYYKENPHAFFSAALDVELDEQQLELLKCSIKPGARVAVKSARGTGKSFMIACLTLYYLLTHDDVSIRIFSPSYTQLTTVFMREVKKLHYRLDPTLRDLLEVFSDKIVSKLSKVNFAQCITASADHSESLSGQHSEVQLLFFDEASAIGSEVYDTTLGSLGTAVGGGNVILVSNPTRGDGFYSDLFEKKLDGWDLLTFTAEKCPRISEDFIKEQEDLYGVDHDQYRVNVLGEFPKNESLFFIPAILVEEAVERRAPYYEYNQLPITLGVDVARSLSGDKSVITIKQGNKLVDIIAFQSEDSMEVVAKMVEANTAYTPSAIYIDSTGVGGPVGDRARELGLNVIDVIMSGKSTDRVQYSNMRAQLWGSMRDWLRDGDIPDHLTLKKELRTMSFSYDNRMAVLLTSKKKLRSSGVSSPDFADSLSLHFYHDAIEDRRSRYSSGKREVRKSSYLFI